ncbi:MAG TPA: pantoate--beta-alanine ligase [Thermomicrobiales bacterium]|nr:pantoate--beta-alanine ligase [Thermomicrobiales bacterium]
MTPHVVRTRAGIRAALGDDAPGLVPTMGALHAGHAALIRRSVAENERTVVSIFVNPTQFSDQADLAAYPRSFDDDLATVAAAGADLVFAPTVGEMYPPGFSTAVDVDGLSRRWEGASRPGHFRGVATVVAILLGLIRPARAYFGEKDYQQLTIVRRLHADLALPGVVVGCPTVRGADGLALSSRNARLSAADRATAAALPRALAVMADLARDGVRDAARLEAAGCAELEAAPEIEIDYLAVVDGATLEPVAEAAAGSRVLAAVRLGGVRLIDNIALPAPESSP